MTPSRRARRAVALAALAGLTLTGCGAGVNAQTNQRQTYSEGANEVFPGGQLLVRNIYLAAPPVSDPVWHEGDDVRGYAVLVNQGDEPDRLLRVTSPVATAVSFWSGGDPREGIDANTEEFLELYQPAREARPGGTDTRAVPGSVEDDLNASEDAPSPSPSPSPGGRRQLVPLDEIGASPSASPTPGAASAGDGEPVDGYTVPLGDKTEILPGAGYLLFEGLLTDVYPGTTVEVTMEFERAGSHTFPATVAVLGEPAERETPEEVPGEH